MNNVNLENVIKSLKYFFLLFNFLTFHQFTLIFDHFHVENTIY